MTAPANKTKENFSNYAILSNRNMQIISLISLMAVVGVASLTPAFPSIARHFNIEDEEVTLLITFFTFPGIVLTPVFGVLADRYGRKTVLVPSLLLFGIMGFLCMTTESFNLLLTYRFFQGVGVASLSSLNITLIGDLFSGTNRSAAMGLNAGIISVGTAAFPIIGGLLASLGWAYPFWLTVLGVPIAFVVLFGLKTTETHSKQNLKEYFLKSWQAVKNRQVLGLSLISILTFMLLFGVYISYLPILLDSSFDASPGTIGLLLSSTSVAVIFVSMKYGALTRRFLEHRLILAGSILYALSMVLIPNIDSLWWLIVPAALYGIAQGFNIPSIQNLLVIAAPPQQRAAIMSLNSTLFRVGQTLGPLAVAPLFILGATDYVFYSGAVMALLMFFFALFMVKAPIRA